jgi:inhibitor of cysteine peptidase
VRLLGAKAELTASMTRVIALVFVAAIAGSALEVTQTPQPEDKNAQQAGTIERTPSQLLTITTDDNGKDITLPKNGRLLVRLPGNPSTGYSWVLSGDPSPLVLVTTDYQRGSQRTGMMGAPQTQQLRFTTNGSGTASLHLAYRRPWEKEVAPAKTFSVTVQVQ